MENSLSTALFSGIGSFAATMASWNLATDAVAMTTLSGEQPSFSLSIKALL